MSLYYLDDYSLGEIAEEFGISRQAVYDNIKRTEMMLEDYESKLHLLKKYQQRQQLVEQLRKYLEELEGEKGPILECIDSLEKLD